MSDKPWAKVQCDGLFLMFALAAAGVVADPSYESAREHVDSCERCRNAGRSHSDADWLTAGYKGWRSQ